MDEVDQIEQVVGQALNGVAAGIEVLEVCETTEGRRYYTQPNIASLNISEKNLRIGKTNECIKKRVTQ